MRTILAFILLSLSVLGVAKAEVGLIEVCRSGTAFGTTQATLCPDRSWERPANGKAVLSCGVGQTQCPWGNPEFRYRLWEDIAPDQRVMTCSFDIPVGPFSSVDPCGSVDSVKPRIPKSEVVGFVAGPIVNGRGTARLTWLAPTRRTDGTVLPASEIGGYVIGYGTESRVYTTTIDVPNGETTQSEVVLDLSGPATIFFAVRARDTEGLLSAWSNEATKTFTLELEDLPPEAPTELEVEISVTCEVVDSSRACVFHIE